MSDIPKIDHANRAHALLSASSAERWLACPPSALIAATYPNQDTVFTREGTEAHELAEHAARIAPHYDMFFSYYKEVGKPQEMIDCAREYADYIQEQIRTPDALVLLEQRVDFSPWVPDGFGTADCIIIQGDTMDVIDYKYGQGVAVSAVGNPQEKLYGLGALNDYGFAYDITRVRLHIFQPRINNTSVDELMVDELTAWGETVKPVAAQAAKGEGEFCPGSHCKFCPHGGRCRALAGVCSEYVETHGLHVDVPVLAPHEYAEFLRMEPLVTLWLKRMKEHALNSMLDGKRIPGYKVVEGKQGNRKWADELHVLSVLEGAGYATNDITEVRLLSPAAMDKAIGKKKVAELLADCVVRAPGTPTIVHEDDKRQEYNPVNDFQKLD